MLTLTVRGQARFAGWLMARMMGQETGAPEDERLRLDRHELALRVLMLVAERDNCGLATLVDHPEVVDCAIRLALAAKS
jgi:hypothetical protein